MILKIITIKMKKLIMYTIYYEKTKQLKLHFLLLFFNIVMTFTTLHY